ncbi:hypothetical protein [Ekhidna sp.]|uniref:hypothetical protein n=1 Tax=Ekhidna sp. TaxID=2608089 RepID=UPI003CCBD168
MRLTIIFLPLIFISCLPDRLVPYDYSIEKDNREAFIELDSFTVALTNLEVKGDHYVFGLEIENKSNQPLFINMGEVQKYAHHLPYREAETSKSFQEVTSAMTPEQVNAFFKAKRDNAEAAAFLLFLVGAAITTYDAIKDEEDNNKTYWTENDEKKSQTREAITSVALLATDVMMDVAAQSSASARTELHYLPKELFDREVIYPNESYYGKVFFKKFGVLKDYHRITLPLDEKKLHFDFRKATKPEKQYLYERGY